ncbi:MAG: hypothetical protein OXH57_09165 [Ekhidna sp.]|nr:hypothetical protein [Ekhidna sp.]
MGISRQGQPAPATQEGGAILTWWAQAPQKAAGHLRGEAKGNTAGADGLREREHRHL